MPAEGSGITSRYASFGDYAARESVDDDQQSAVESMLTAMSRSLDRRLGVFPGGFTSRDATSFEFDAHGGDRLWLRDSASLVYPLRALSAGGVRPDYDRTGDYANTLYGWDFDDAFLWPIPRNHAELDEPARGLMLRRLRGAPRVRWPYGDGAVQVTGDWGWATTPEAITELVISRTRDLRDVQRAGASATVADVGGGEITFTDDSWMLWRAVESAYSYRRAPSVGSARR